MLDLKVIAAGRGLDIPSEQLERINPVMQKLQDELQRVLHHLPEGPASAIAFQAREENEA
jgi:hypothetical protein